MSEITLEGGLLAFDPRGVVDAQAQPISPRPARLEGRRLAVLDNSKWNANRLLAATTARLSRDVEFASVAFWKKESFSRNAVPELLAQITEEGDVALVAIGD
jgi:hypothetical protein